MSGSIRIYDTTVRDGFAEVGPVVSIEQAVTIARGLDRAGVSTIAAGYPAQSQWQREITKAVAAAVTGSEVAALASCDVSEVIAAMEAVREAKKPVVHIYVSGRAVGEPRVRTHLTRAIRQAVSMVRAACIPVQFSIFDIEEMERPFRRQCIDVAVHAGATRIGVPDNSGEMDATSYAGLVRDIVTFVGPHVVVSAHCHNASGRAVENTMAAIEAGAKQVETTVHGVGASGGNAALENVVERIYARYGTSPVDVDAIVDIDVEGDTAGMRKSVPVVGVEKHRARAAASPVVPEEWCCRVEVAAL
jgi:2-isopropylmalate synthase